MTNDDRSIPCSDCVRSSTDAAPSSSIGRRTFLAQSAVMAAVAALAACGASGDFTAPQPLTSSTTINLSDQPALATVGGMALVSISSIPIAIVRTSASTFLALSRVCPHQGSIVNPTSSGFLCPNHGAQFSSTGTWVGGERTNSLLSYTTSYDAVAGTITIA